MDVLEYPANTSCHQEASNLSLNYFANLHKNFFSDAKSNSSIVNLFFQVPERWSPNVLQFLASMVHLGQFVYELLHGFLVLEWALIFESKEVSSLSSGVCVIAFFPPI